MKGSVVVGDVFFLEKFLIKILLSGLKRERKFEEHTEDRIRKNASINTKASQAKTAFSEK